MEQTQNISSLKSMFETSLMKIPEFYSKKDLECGELMMDDAIIVHY